MVTKRVSKMTGEMVRKCIEVGCVYWGGRQILLSSSPFLKLLRKERSREEEKSHRGHCFWEAMPLREHAPARRLPPVGGARFARG